MSRPDLGDRILITSGTYGGQYGIFVGPTIGLGKRGKVRLDIDQQIHRLSYTKMLVLPEAATVVPSPESPSPIPSQLSGNVRLQASSPSVVTSFSSSQSNEVEKESAKQKLARAVEKLSTVTEQLLELQVLVNELQAIILSEEM